MHWSDCLLCGEGKMREENEVWFKGNKFQKYFQKNPNSMDLDYFECVFRGWVGRDLTATDGHKKCTKIRERYFGEDV